MGGVYMSSTAGWTAPIQNYYDEWQPVITATHTATFSRTKKVLIKEWWLDVFPDNSLESMSNTLIGPIGFRVGLFSAPPSNLSTNVLYPLALDKAEPVDVNTQMRVQNVQGAFANSATFEDGGETHYMGSWKGRYHWVAPLDQERVLHLPSYWRIEAYTTGMLRYHAGIVWEETR